MSILDDLIFVQSLETLLHNVVIGHILTPTIEPVSADQIERFVVMVPVTGALARCSPSNIHQPDTLVHILDLFDDFFQPFLVS